jgi:ABC-2 type transport system permease protein
MSELSASSGVIHDLGYRRYEGIRLGRFQIARALSWHSFRSAFGLGRGVKAKIVPVITFVLICLPAVVNAVLVATGRGHTRQINYDTYIFQLRVVVMAIFVAVQAPELVSRDLRSHVLPLYFSRPVRRLDYPLAKLAAFVAACLVMVEIPLLLLYLGTIVSASGPSAVWGETKALIPGLLVGAMWAITVAVIGLALASLSGRRAYATGAIAIYFFLTLTLAGILHRVARGAGGPLFVSGPTTGARLSGLVSPFTVMDGVRRWLGGTSPGPVPDLGPYGPLYGLMLLALVVVGLGILFARYRKVGVA